MGNQLKSFKQKIAQKKFKIAVVGLGYVGLPLAIEFARRGIEVSGIDVDSHRISRLKKKESYITDISDKELRQVLALGRLNCSQEFSALETADVIIICVPTPLKRKYHPNISYIRQAVKAISKYLKKGSLVILESTTYPGTTEDVILPLLKERNRKHNQDFYLAFSPERIDPGNKQYPVHKIPKIVGGLSKEATGLAVLVYKNIIDNVVPVSSTRVAEFVKLLENTFRLINIGMIDEMAMMAHKMGVDIWEVIKAASTKPFGFMTFYPGPGVGGHCLDGEEKVFIREGNALKAMRLSEFVCHLEETPEVNRQILSFDPVKKETCFREILAASARPYSGRMIKVTTEDGRVLKLTDLHPMFIYNNRWQLKYAKDLQKGDRLPVFLGLPDFDKISNIPIIDLLAEIRKNKDATLIAKTRVKPVGFQWKEYSQELKKIFYRFSSKLPDKYWDCLRENVLPLGIFYELEDSLKIDHHKLSLVSGRGPSYSSFPAVVELNSNFFRLVGYYLSEGCHTQDSSSRIRFSFNRNEKEYIEDVVTILHNLKVKTSIYESKKWQTTCIKVSSNLFGFLITEVLGCGTNCYNMQIPAEFFHLNKEKKIALLSGIFRGDACVEHFFGKWRYRKNQKEYFHRVNTANISYFTSSQKLFQQLIILLHDLEIIPTFKKRKNTLSIFGYRQLEFFKDVFAGKKKEILTQYLELNKNRPQNKTFRQEGGFATVRVKDIASIKGNMVYSVETAKPHSFITSYGIAVHNCIPKDPLYLYWKARHHGFRSRFIKLASDVINFMPGYVVSRMGEVLRKNGKEISKSRILVLGVTYKKDVLDLRKSPALDVIEILQKNGVSVSYYDPLVPYLKMNHLLNLESIKLESKNLKKFDCVCILADHTSVNYDFVLKHARLVFDTRNVYKGAADKKIVKL